MSRLRHAGKILDRLSPWIAIVFIAIGFYVVHEQGQEIKDSRRNAIIYSCREANERHDQAKVLVDQLVAKGPKPPKPLTKAQQKAKDEQVALFVEAIAPKYDCRARLALLTRT